MFNYEVHLDLEDQRNADGFMREGIKISVSKETGRIFINNITSEPIDSWGANWKTCQSCVIVNKEEIKELIKLLQIAEYKL